MSINQTLTSFYEDTLASMENPRQRASMERVKAACDYLEANGLKISPTKVERYCVDRGWEGPKAQSIRNSKLVLLRYLELRKSGQSVQQSKKTGSGEPDIADESLRAYVQLLKQERDQAIAEANRIKAGLRGIPGIRVDELLRSKFSDTPITQPPNSTQASTPIGPLPLSPSQRSAMGALLDPARLSLCGLELHKDRLRQQSTRNVLLEKTEVEALRSLLLHS